MASAYFNKIIGQKREENSTLRDQQDALIMQLKGLRAAIKLAEMRKAELEKAITEHEKYLYKALKMLDIDVLESDGEVRFYNANQ